MKKWVAYLLVLCMCLTPVLACAQDVSTEAMIGNLLVRMAEQLLSPSFALKLERPGNMLEAGLALDEQGVPDVFFGMRVGADQIRFDADAAGLRYRENEHTIAITPELLLRVLTTDETGASLLPDVREEDVQLLMEAAYGILGAAATAVSVEGAAPETGETAAQQNMKITLDVNAMLAALDTAIPAVLLQYADELNALLERNRAYILSQMGAAELPDVRQLAQAWPQGLLAGLIPPEYPVLAVVEQQQTNVMAAVLCAGLPVADLRYTPGRLSGAFGPEGRYAFDTDDLKQLAQMIAKYPSYISDKALNGSLRVQDGIVVAHLGVNTEQLVRDAVTGVMHIVRDHPAQIDTLIARYAPWLELAGESVQDLPTWESLYTTLYENRDEICKNLSNSLLSQIGRNRNLVRIMGMNMPWVEVDLYAKAATGKPLEMVLSAKMTGAEAELTISGYTVSGWYTVNESLNTHQGYMSGYLDDSRVQLTLSQAKNQKIQNEWKVSAEKDGDCWTALLHNMAGEQLAQLCIEPERMELTTDTLKAQLLDTGTGFSFALKDDEHDVRAQWYEHDGVWNARLYADGNEYHGMMASDKDAEVIRLTFREPLGPLNELQLRAGAESLQLRAGTTFAGRMTGGVELNAQWSDQMPRLDVKRVLGATDQWLRYLPGDLEAGMKNVRSNDSWILRVKDMSRKDGGMNVTRAEVTETHMVSVPKSDNPEEKIQIPETTKQGWTLRTQPGETQWTMELKSDNGEKTLLTLDFDAKANHENAAEYGFVNEEQARSLLGKLLAQ